MSVISSRTGGQPHRAPTDDDVFLAETLERLRALRAASGESRRLRDEFVSPGDFAEWLNEQLPKRSAWDRVVGPFYTTDQLTKRFEVSRQALFDRVQRRTLLGLRTSDGQVLYPTFQFSGASVVAGLSEVLQAVSDVIDDWTLASWLVARQPGLGMSVIEALKLYGPTEEVTSVTRRAIERWAR